MKTFLERVQEDLDNTYVELYMRIYDRISGKNKDSSFKWTPPKNNTVKLTHEELTIFLNGKRV